MSTYMTEEEQIEAIKKWWRRYSTPITIILSVILLAASGYRYWQWHENKVNTQASNAYEHLMVAFSNHDNKAIKAYANQLTQQFSDTVYADAARMTLAKLYVSRDKLDKALEPLEYVASHSRLKALRQVARLRIARIMAAQKAYDKAIGELATVDDDSYMPLINELKGDIYTATGNYQQAAVAYKDAISEARTNGIGNQYLEMKTNELATLTQSMNVGASAPRSA
ncbi:YfgM family protein [Legionella dresdenensis]|uniref:Ancillary SecYEG translocon subunit n=1 Tax=Legionella dresdenensis TaxID=450200 RepID=A0ABV8CBI0_9GAMM